MNQHQTKSGFTLSELLAVIAIVAVVSAILFPVFARMRDRERDKQSDCYNNMKQMGLGFLEYQQDYDETYPGGINATGTGNGWAGQLYPYVRSSYAFTCPSDSTPTTQYTDHTSYGYNSQNVTVSSGYPVGPKGQSYAQYNQPSKTVILFEVRGSNGYTVVRSNVASTRAGDFVPGDDYYPLGGGSPAGYGVGGPFDPSGFNSNAGVAGGSPTTLKYATGYLRNKRNGPAEGDFAESVGRHNYGANYAMADGHVKFLLPANVSGGYANTTASGTDCGNGNPDNPTAAQTGCTDNSIMATFNTQ